MEARRTPHLYNPAMLTFPSLFALGLGKPLNPGAHRCFWCGASCDSRFRSSISDTFWDYDAVAFPRSDYQCAGCVECLNELRAIAGYDKPQKTRNHSWFASSKPEAFALNKSTLARMRDICLNPPRDLDWGMALADSGQKHILFRSPVNLAGSSAFAVQLELLTIRYIPFQLKHAVDRCALFGSIIGKPPLSGPLDAACAIRLIEAGIDSEFIEQWNAEWNAPLWRLASFLCPGRDDCHAYLDGVDAGGIPAAVGGTEGRAGERSLFD